MLPHVPGVRLRHGLLLRAMLAWAHRPPDQAMLGPAQKYGPRAGLTGSGYMPIYRHGEALGPAVVTPVVERQGCEAAAVAHERQGQGRLERWPGVSVRELG